MAEIIHLPHDSPASDIVNAIEEQGAVIVDEFVTHTWYNKNYKQNITWPSCLLARTLDQISRTTRPECRVRTGSGLPNCRSPRPLASGSFSPRPEMRRTR